MVRTPHPAGERNVGLMGIEVSTTMLNMRTIDNYEENDCVEK
jgi:hypothetical protein